MIIKITFIAVKNPRPAIDIRNRPRIPVPDEDPYSIAGSGSSGSSGNGNRERSRDKPPKLPPRDNNSIYATGGLGRIKVRYPFYFKKILIINPSFFNKDNKENDSVD